MHTTGTLSHAQNAISLRTSSLPSVIVCLYFFSSILSPGIDQNDCHLLSTSPPPGLQHKVHVPRAQNRQVGPGTVRSNYSALLRADHCKRERAIHLGLHRGARAVSFLSTGCADCPGQAATEQQQQLVGNGLNQMSSIRLNTQYKRPLLQTAQLHGQRARNRTATGQARNPGKHAEI